MAQPPIDYEQLAREQGGTKVTPTPSSPPDYAALARDAGGTTAPMNVAVVNGQRVPVEAGGVRGFLEEATPGINPVKISEALSQAFWHPLDTAKGLLAAQDVPRREAMTAFEQGDPITGTRKLIDWLIPVLGPRLDEAADYMQQGQVARGLGATTDVGLALATPKIAGTVAGALPTRAGLARGLNQAAESRVVRAITPQGRSAANMRFGTMAADVAPDIARRTTASTVGGLGEEVGGLAAAANQKLNAAYAAVPATSAVSTSPILAGLARARERLSVRGPSGGSIDPATRAARLASVDQAIQEARALGPRATIQDLRKLRQAWDEGAEEVFTPIAADNFRVRRDAGHGWADARTVLDDVMVTAHPELAPLNADVSLWISAQDVLQAVQDAERVRPTVGRSLMARGLGAATGYAGGGGWGATLGATLGPSLEAALSASAPTVKLTTARAMARLADALRAGQRGQATAAMLRVSAVLPAAERAAFQAQAIRLMRDLEPAAAREEGPASGASPAGARP